MNKYQRQKVIDQVVDWVALGFAAAVLMGVAISLSHGCMKPAPQNTEAVSAQ